jgi:hypothetical protein
VKRILKTLSPCTRPVGGASNLTCSFLTSGMLYRTLSSAKKVQSLTQRKCSKELPRLKFQTRRKLSVKWMWQVCMFILVTPAENRLLNGADSSDNTSWQPFDAKKRLLYIVTFFSCIGGTLHRPFQNSVTLLL